MPSVSLHLCLADEVLESWRRGLAAAPFDPLDPLTVRAFRHGALGPDLGYFPGGQRILSDLAHRVRSVDLTRTLVASARSSTERAFSWGWLTHVLADGAIHPLVGLAVGEVLHGMRTCFVGGLAEPALHVRIETGLDLAYRDALGDLSTFDLPPLFGPTSIGFLERAYRSTYGVELGSEPYLRSHLAAARMARAALFVTSWLRRLHFLDPRARFRRAPLRVLARAYEGLAERKRDGHLALAYLNPISPSPWLLDAVAREARTFTHRFFEQYETGIASLQNFDLDSGRPDVPVPVRA